MKSTAFNALLVATVMNNVTQGSTHHFKWLWDRASYASRIDSRLHTILGGECARGRLLPVPCAATLSSGVCPDHCSTHQATDQLFELFLSQSHKSSGHLITLLHCVAS